VKKAFTLIELMIIVAIIGILVIVSIPPFMKYIKRSKTTEPMENLRKLYDSSVSQYDADYVSEDEGPVTPELPLVHAEENDNGNVCNEPKRERLKNLEDRLKRLSNEIRPDKRIKERKSPARTGTKGH